MRRVRGVNYTTIKLHLQYTRRCHGNVVYTRTPTGSSKLGRQLRVYLVPLPSMSHSSLDDVYFDFNYFISSALEDASFRVNKLSSLHDWVRAPAGQQVLKELKDANVLYHTLSRATGVFQTIGNLLLRIGMRALLVLIAILVGVPLWLLSTSLEIGRASCRERVSPRV